MRLFCIQHGLRDRHSHFLQESVGLVEACAARGLSLRLYAHRRLDPSLAAVTGAIPAFRHAAATALETDPVFGVLSDYIALGAAFAADCAALTADGAGAGDLVLLPYAEAWSLHGLGLWLAGLPEERRPRVAAHVVIPERNWWLEDGRSRFTGDPAYIRHAATRLREAAPTGGAVLAASAPRLAQLVAALAEHPCRSVPLPMHYPSAAELAGLAAARAHPPVDLAIAGQFRREKGSGLVAPLLTALAAERPGCRVALQVNAPADAEALAEALADAAESLELFLQVGECDRAAWYARILAARLMLLPYEPASYAARTSGVLAEAACCGVAVVVPAETWLADQIEAGHAAGTCFAAHDVTSILAAIGLAERHRQVLATQAAGRAAHWRETQTVAAWLDAMIAA